MGAHSGSRTVLVFHVLALDGGDDKLLDNDDCRGGVSDKYDAIIAA